MRVIVEDQGKLIGRSKRREEVEYGIGDVPPRFFKKSKVFVLIGLIKGILRSLPVVWCFPRAPVLKTWIDDQDEFRPDPVGVPRDRIDILECIREVASRRLQRIPIDEKPTLLEDVADLHLEI